MLSALHDSMTLSFKDQPQQIWKIADSGLKIIEKFSLDDSLKTIWLDIRTEAMISLNQKDSAMRLLTEERQRALRSGNAEIIIFTNLCLGEYYLDDGKNKLAGQCLREGYTWAEKSGNEFQVARANNLLGSLLRAEGNYHESQDYLFRALGLFEKQRKYQAVGPVCTNIALNYQAIGDTIKSRKYMIKALDIAQSEKDTLNMLASINNLVVLYRFASPDSAMYFCRLGLSLTRNPAYWFQALSLKFNLGNLRHDRKEYGFAEAIFAEVLAICEEKNIPGGIARCYNSIAAIHEVRNQDEAALQYYMKAYAIADSLGDPPLMTTFLYNLMYMNRKMGNYQKALQWSEKYQAARDSMLTLEKQLAVHELEMLYNTEKTELENQRLSHSVSQMKTRVRTISILLAIGLFIVLVISMFTFIIYRLYRQRDIAYNILFDQLKSGTGVETLLQKMDDLHKPAHDNEQVKIKPVIQELITWLETEKPYLDGTVRLETAAKKLNMPKSALSNDIHEWAGMHFNALLNTYRIAEALRILALPESKTYKIETVAKMAGFGSRAAFYEAFTKVTGTTPTEYRKEDPAEPAK